MPKPAVCRCGKRRWARAETYIGGDALNGFVVCRRYGYGEGGDNTMHIDFCPWCGKKLPRRTRG